MNTEQLSQITTLTSDINTHFERAFAASMEQDNGQPDLAEMTHQINLAKLELQKLNELVFPASAEITELILEQHSEIEALQNDIYNLNSMD